MPNAPTIIWPDVTSRPQYEYSSIFFKWKSEKNATSYQIQISDCENCSDFLVDTSFADTTYVTRWSDLGGKNVYYWNVKAINECNIASDYTYSSFSVVQRPWEHGYSNNSVQVLINGNLIFPSINLDTLFQDLVVTARRFFVDYIPSIYPSEQYVIFETPPFFNFQVSKTTLDTFYTGGFSDGTIVTGNLDSYNLWGNVNGELIFSGNIVGQVTVETIQ